MEDCHLIDGAYEFDLHIYSIMPFKLRWMMSHQIVNLVWINMN